MNLRSLVLDDFLLYQIALVADEQLVDTFGSVSINLLQPLFDVVKRIVVRHIVDDNDPVCATVVRRRDGSESLLARGLIMSIPSVTKCMCVHPRFAV